MKLSEIKIGDDYEIKQHGVGTIGTVVEVGTFKLRAFYGSRDFSGHVVEKKGVRVVFPYNRPDVVNWFLPQQVVRPAADARDAKAHAEAAANAMEAHAARITAALRKHGFEYASAYVSHRDGGRRLTVSLDSEMDHLLALLENTEAK